MQTLVNFFTANPYVLMAVNLSGLIGVLLAFFFYFRSKERFALSYRVAEKLLIQSSSTLPFDMDVPLSRKGVEVSRLTRSFILVSNTGNKLIERADFVSMPLVKVSEPSSILDYELVFADDPGSAVMLGPPEGHVRNLSLDFLRPGDGFILKIDHTGSINEMYIDLRTKAGGPIKKISEGKRRLWFLAITIPALIILGVVVDRVFPIFGQKDLPTIIYLMRALFVGGILLVVFVAMGALIETAIDRALAKFRRSQPAKVRRAKSIFSDIGLNKKDAAIPVKS